MDRVGFLLYPNAEAGFLPLSPDAPPQGRRHPERTQDLELDFLLHRTIQMPYEAFLIETTLICLGNLCWLALLLIKVRDLLCLGPKRLPEAVCVRQWMLRHFINLWAAKCLRRRQWADLDASLVVAE